MAAGFTLSTDHGAVSRGIGRLAAMGRDLVPLLQDLGQEGEDSTVLRFDTNIAPDGAPWKPSLRATITGGKTLVESTRLRDSIHYQLDGDDAVEWGSNVIYAGVHQAGATITAKGGGALTFTLATGATVMVKSVTLPARAFLGISAHDSAEMLDIVEGHFHRAVGGA